MERTEEYANEICDLIELARKKHFFEGMYKSYYLTLEPKPGYYVLLDNNCRLFIYRQIVQDYAKTKSSLCITDEDLDKIAKSLQKM